MCVYEKYFFYELGDLNMKYLVDYDEIDKYWKNDYFFCEDKILATMAEKFGCKYDLMFSGAFDFG